MKTNALNPKIQNEIIQNAVLNSIYSIFPITGKYRTLTISDLEPEKDELYRDDIPLQKEVKLAGKSWELPLYATISVKDNVTGDILDKSRIKIANVPKITNRFSTIIKGNEYQTVNQFRLKSGVYTREKENGEFESQFNLEKGFNFKLNFTPEKQIFLLSLGNQNYHLYTLLRALGISDDVMKKAWGKEIFDKNQRNGLNVEFTEIPQIYKKVRHKEVDFMTALEGLKKYFDEETKISPETTKITLGNSHDRVTPELFLEASRKLLQVVRGETPSDERDSLVFKDLYSIDDLLKAHFEARKDMIAKNIKYRLDTKTAPREIISGDTFNKPLLEFFYKGELSSTPTQTNPVDIVTEWRKTTIMGVGGVRSEHAITDKMRDVHPSHMGFLDAVSTTEGNPGITLNLGIGVHKDVGGQLRTPIVFTSGKRQYVTPFEIYNLKLGYPDQFIMVSGKPKANNDLVKGIYQGKASSFPKNEIDAYLERATNMFTFSTNLIPFVNYNSGGRAMYGSKQMAQAVPLKFNEAPLVQVKVPERLAEGAKPIGSMTYEEGLGNFLNPIVREGKEGTVTKITDDYIYIKSNSGKTSKIGLYNKFPLNQESFLHSTPVVQIGDSVKKGQVIAINNFQKQNALALGTNLLTAYMPWKGQTFDDSVIVSETGAKKLTSIHLFKEELKQSKTGTGDINKFNAYFPGRLKPDNAEKLDNNGVIREGEIVEPGEYLAIYMEPRDLTDEERVLKSMRKVLSEPYIDMSITWDHETSGKILYVRNVGKNVEITIETEAPAVIGDKVTNRAGAKGIISKIVPDTEMPHTPDGRSIEYIISPLGYPGRTNTGQILETAAGKIAEKQGKPYVVRNFDGTNWLDKIKTDLKDNSLQSEEILTDGKDGKAFENPILVGPQHVYKLRHTIEHKFSSRAYGKSYSIDEQPTSGGANGGASLDQLQSYGLLGHGAKANIYDSMVVKGQKNDEIWRALSLGLPIPPPNTNFVWDKFKSYMNGLGVDLVREGTNIRMVPLTDKKVLEISAGKIDNAGYMLKGKNLATIKGGLFDQDITGGPNGKKYAHIELSEKLPNPMFERAIQIILNLTSVQFDDVMSGKKDIDGKTGPEGVISALKKLNVEQEIDIAKSAINDTSNPALVNKLNKKLRYLTAIKNSGMSLEEAYTMKYVPVLPPLFRPIVPLPSGDLHVAPINEHYRDIAILDNSLQKEKELGDKDRANVVRNELYRTVSAAQGHVDPITYKKNKYEGLLKTLSGDSPKSGFIQNVMWKKRQDLSGRTTITLEPDLGLDEVGLPDEMAKKIYKPFVIRELVRTGFKPIEAIKNYRDWTLAADRALDNVMKERPVLVNRAPSLHKWNVQALIPQRHNGRDLKFNPIVQGFNQDYDGDTMAVYVPVSDEAVQEAWAMLPSRNMFHPSKDPYNPNIIHNLGKEYLLGLYHMTRDGDKTNKSYNTLNEAIKAEERGDIKVRDFIHIKGKSTTLGRELLTKELPGGLKVTGKVDAKVLKNLFGQIAKEYPADISKVMNTFKDYGKNYGHKFATSIALADFDIPENNADQIFKKYEIKINPALPDNKKAELWVDMTDEMHSKNEEALKKLTRPNNFKYILDSGAISGAKATNVNQILSSVGAVKDINNKPLPVPIKGNWATGLDTWEYWQQLYGSRKGVVDKAINTQDSGEVNKSLLNNTKSVLITEEDCGTDDYLELDSDDRSLAGRFLFSDVPGIGKKNTPITAELLVRIASKGNKLKVRSPLTCDAVQGVCQLCYGLLPNGKVPPIGYNVGVVDSQALTERSTQLTLSAFHSGASAAKGSKTIASSFQDFDEILKVPEILPGKSTLSTKTGTVGLIRNHPAGGYEVFVDGTPHYIPAGMELAIRSGQKVMSGDKLSIGKAKPQELAKLKDFKTAQKDMVNRLKNIYGDEFHSRAYETVVRGVSDLARIKRVPLDIDDIYPGDTIYLSLVKKINKDRKGKGKDLIEYEPYFRAINVQQQDRDDWLGQMSSGHIKQNLIEAAASMRTTNLHGKDPLPGMLYGLEFGKEFDPKKGIFY